MEVSWGIWLHIAIALTSVGMTLTWERLRQHSRTIDSITKQTQYLTRMTYWTMIRLWKRMDSLEEEVHAIQMDGPEEHDGRNDNDPCNVPSSNVYTWDFESNPIIPTFTNGYPWTMQDAPWAATSHVPDSVSDNDDGSVEDNVGEIECSDFTEDEDDKSDKGSVGDDADPLPMPVGDNRGTDDTW